MLVTIFLGVECSSSLTQTYFRTISVMSDGAELCAYALKPYACLCLFSLFFWQIGGDDVADDPDWSSCCIGESPFDSCRDLSLPASFDDVPC